LENSPGEELRIRLFSPGVIFLSLFFCRPFRYFYEHRSVFFGLEKW